MVTGSSGGFVTVWDVKAKKESLTLNNMGRKAVSAVAWDPEKVSQLFVRYRHMMTEFVPSQLDSLPQYLMILIR